MKTTFATVAGFLDLATIPIRAVFAHQAADAPNTQDTRRVALIRQTPDGISVENLLFVGNKETCVSKVGEMVRQGEKIVLEDFPLEDVVELCFKHNYRWRIHPGSKSGLRFVIEPGRNPDPAAAA